VQALSRFGVVQVSSAYVILVAPTWLVTMAKASATAEYVDGVDGSVFGEWRVCSVGWVGDVRAHGKQCRRVSRR